MRKYVVVRFYKDKNLADKAAVETEGVVLDASGGLDACIMGTSKEGLKVTDMRGKVVANYALAVPEILGDEEERALNNNKVDEYLEATKDEDVEPEMLWRNTSKYTPVIAYVYPIYLDKEEV